MTKLKKVIVSAFIMITLTLPVTLNAHLTVSSATIDSLYADYCKSILTISGKTATCKSIVIGINGKTTKIVVSQTLQQKTSSGNWKTIAAWSKGEDGYSFTYKNTKSSLSKGTYRLNTVATVYSGNKSETMSDCSPAVTVK